MKIHDEITYQGKPLVIDTTSLPNFHGTPGGPTFYETMALRSPGGLELDCVTTHDEQEARKNHAAMLKKYSKQPDAPLTGKYAKLRDDLLAAYAETEHIEQTEDGGTCNFDAPTLDLPRWNADKIKQAAKDAGGSAWKWTWGNCVMGWVFSPRSSGQANRRSRRAEAISAALKAKGYNAGMYCAMD